MNDIKMSEPRLWIGNLISDSLAKGNRHQAAKLSAIAKDHDKLIEQNKMLREALIDIGNMTDNDLTEELYLFSGFGKKYTYSDLVNKIHDTLEVTK